MEVENVESVEDVNNKSGESTAESCAKDVKTEEVKKPEIKTDCNLEDNSKKDSEDHVEGGSVKDDPYSYLDENGFTSEKYKIEVRNLPRHYGLREFKNLLNNKLNLGVNKVKSPGNRKWIYVCFRNEDDKKKGIATLDGYHWKGRVLRADTAKAVPDPLVKRRLENAKENTAKKLKSGIPIGDLLKDATIPLWRMPYQEQLVKKELEVKGLLKKLSYDLIKANPNLHDWINKQRDAYDGLPCELLPMRHTEIAEDGYRNKCEFSVGRHEETDEITVGFRLGSYAKGSVSVAPVDGVLSVPSRMKLAASLFQQYIRTSPLNIFNVESQQGFWKQLTARYGFRTDQLMLLVGMNPQNLTDEQLASVATEVKTFFTEGPGKECCVTSLYLHLMERRPSEERRPYLRLLAGEKYITEKLLDKTFRISPLAFFQINTGAAEILYSTIAEVTSLTTTTTVLDVCCGTGTIGISMADKCGQVLGVELSQEAVNDAEENALANDVYNAEFHSGKAEEILSSVVRKATCPEIVAIVDPPRAGLQQDALVQLRKTPGLNKLVYVSCEPRLAMNNFINLGRCESKLYQREPLVPVKAILVDMFPHTNHSELVLYFERLPPQEK